MTVRLIAGDCREVLRTLPDASVHCVVTSPPYWGLRDYGHAGQIGLEASHLDYVSAMVGVFREVRRVLREDGTCWLNIGDSYRDKSLVGIPWYVSMALRDDGWLLRQDIIWAKPNPMPESVRDRCTKAHEYIFLLAKSERYWFDAAAIAEKAKYPGDNRASRPDLRKEIDPMCRDGGSRARTGNPTGETVNRRSVWTVTSEPFEDAHFATFPPALIEPCILAGCPAGGTVLDPFGGAATTGLVADRLGRDAILIELNPEYVAMAERRLHRDAGMFASVKIEAAAAAE